MLYDEHIVLEELERAHGIRSIWLVLTFELAL
jgi:hypothetical protein